LLSKIFIYNSEKFYLLIYNIMARENSDWFTKSEFIMAAEDEKRQENLDWIWRLIQERIDDYSMEIIVKEAQKTYKDMANDIVENQNK